MTPRPLEIGSRVLWLERLAAGRIRLIVDDRCIVTLEATGFDRVVFCDDLVELPPAEPRWRPLTLREGRP